MSDAQALIIILLVAGITIALRAAPFLFLRDGVTPPAVTYLGAYLPGAVIAILVIYCFRSVEFLSGTHGLPELVAAVATVVLHIWKRNNLLSIGGGTALYMLLLRL